MMSQPWVGTMWAPSLPDTQKALHLWCWPAGCGDTGTPLQLKPVMPTGVMFQKGDSLVQFCAHIQ